MTRQEAEIAFEEGVPVECKGIEYLYICQLITGKDRNNKKYYQVALLDRGGNSITVDAPEAVHRISQPEEEVEVPF